MEVKKNGVCVLASCEQFTALQQGATTRAFTRVGEDARGVSRELSLLLLGKNYHKGQVNGGIFIRFVTFQLEAAEVRLLLIGV